MLHASALLKVLLLLLMKKKFLIQVFSFSYTFYLEEKLYL